MLRSLVGSEMCIRDRYQDGIGIGTFFSNSAAFGWSNPILGIHDYTARPRDTAGMMSVSAPGRVLVTRPGFQGQSVFFPQFTSTSGLIVQNNACLLYTSPSPRD